MDDVTDTVFRRVVYECAPFDLSMSEFVNVDGLCSLGRNKLLPRLDTSQDVGPVVAQIWGKQPENFAKIAREIASGEIPGFCGIDINFGCPDKAVVKNECCSALQKPELRDKALAIINATRGGVVAARGAFQGPALDTDFMVSFKTRLGFERVDYSWHELLLQQQPHMLTVHVRTTKQMSKVPAQWEAIKPIVQLRNQTSPDTKIILNGDIVDRMHGQELIARFGVDGVMIGRGVFRNPFCFSETAHDDWRKMGREQRISLFKRHLELFSENYNERQRKFAPLKKFAKIYISDFSGAHELRDRIMRTNNVSEALAAL
jgi:tRNA-dihydrouridine synthase